MSTSKTICILTDEAIHAATVHRRRAAVTVQKRSRVDFRLPDSLLTVPDISALVDGTRDLLQGLSETANELILVVPLTWVFTHVLEAGDDLADESALGYALEPFLPLSLEAVTCTFEPLGADRILAVAVPTAPMSQLLDGLAETGVIVDVVTVDALCLAASMRRPQNTRSAVIHDARWVRAAVALDNSELLIGSFRVEGDEDDAIAMRREWVLRCPGCPVPDDWVEIVVVHSTCGEDGLAADDPAEQGHDDAVNHIACTAGSATSVINLRQGVLARESPWAPLWRVVGHCLFLALVVLVVATLGTIREGRALRDRITKLEAQQAIVYRQVFPEGPVPLGAAMRVASERVRWEGLTRGRGHGRESGFADELRPLDVLRDAVAGLPDDLRVMLLEARVDTGQVVLSGQTRSHRDAERLAEVVGRVPRLAARPPQTNRIDSGGVTFTIVAGCKDHGK